MGSIFVGESPFRGVWLGDTLIASPDPAEQLLADAVLWLDAQYAGDRQTVTNLGTGGTALDARLGSTTSPDTNDPKFLDYTGTPYVYLPGVASNSLSVPDEAALDITGDIDIRVRVALDDWTPAIAQNLVHKYISPQRSYAFQVTTTGYLIFYWSSDGSSVLSGTSTVVTGVADGAVKWVRATLDVDNGAAGWDVKFYLSDDGVTWTQLGSTVTSAGVTSIFAGTLDLYLGSDGNGPSPATAKVYRAQVLSGISGTTVLDVDTSVLTSGAATSFTALSGQTVSINRSVAGRKSASVVAPCWLLGTDDYMEVPDNALLDFGASDSFTVLAVVRAWATTPSDESILRKLETATGSTAGWALRYSSTAAYGVQAIAADADSDEADNFVLTNSAAGTAGALQLLGMRLDRGEQLLRAISGTTLNAGQTTAALGSLSNARVMRLGSTDAGGSYLGGEVFAAAVWRRALTPDEIQTVSDYFAGRA